MINRVQMRHAMKTSVSSVILISLFALCAHGGEVERFIRETLEEQRARSECEPSEVAQIVGDAINDSKLPEFELPKESIFTSKDKENDARYYSYDKSGKLISVEYAARPEKNEYYAYDKQGNILEKRIGNSIYKYTYDTANQLMEMESPEGKREYFYDMAGRLVMEKFNGEIDVEYKYGYLDKVIEVNRNGKTTKFAYDGFGMLAQKTFHDGTTEVWVWDGLALIRRGSDIYVNEPHISGGVPILSKTDEGVRKSCKRLPRHNNIWRGKHTKRPLRALYRQTLRRRLAGVCVPQSNIRPGNKEMEKYGSVRLSRRNKCTILCSYSYNGTRSFRAKNVLYWWFF